MHAETSDTSPRAPAHNPARRGGRTGRQQRSASEAAPHGAHDAPKRSIPVFDLLDTASLEKLEEHADWILHKVGVEFRGDDEALALFRNSGAKVDGDRVRFEPGHVRALCASAPSQFKLHARDPNNTLDLGGDAVVLMPGYGSPFVTDLGNGRRYATLEDFENFVKLTFLSPWLSHSGGTICEPTDIPVNKRHLDMVYAHLRLSTKPFMGGVTAPERARDSIHMARLVFGERFMNDNAVMQANINVNSPLVYDHTMSSALRLYAEANQCVAVSPAIFAGAMGPVTPAAVAAQTLAEGMVGIALAQLVRPGCPVVLGSFHSTMSLKSGGLTFGTPEANLATMALSQLGRRLGVPVRSGGGQITASNVPDGQAMQDSANAMWATLLSGAHQVWHAAGWLEGGLTMSYEKFILDCDNCGAMLKFMQGLQVNADTLSRASYDEAGPGENFLSTSHTLQNFASANFETVVPEPGPYETWVENGSLTAAERAHACWKAKLAAYEPPPIDQGIDEALRDFITRRKSDAPDEWY